MIESSQQVRKSTDSYLKKINYDCFIYQDHVTFQRVKYTSLRKDISKNQKDNIKKENKNLIKLLEYLQ